MLRLPSGSPASPVHAAPVFSTLLPNGTKTDLNQNPGRTLKNNITLGAQCEAKRKTTLQNCLGSKNSSLGQARRDSKREDLGRVLHPARGLQAPTKRGPWEGGCETRPQSRFMGLSASPKSKLCISQPHCRSHRIFLVGFFFFFSSAPA